MKHWITEFLKKRIYVFSAVLLLMFFTLVRRFFVLQVVNGGDYLQSFQNQIGREQVYPGSRGIIYDRNGRQLAYNELSYTVTIEDSGAYKSRRERNEILNKTLDRSIALIEETGGTVENYLLIERTDTGEYEFTAEGTRLQRFRADVYGHGETGDLAYNSRLGYDEGSATAEQIVEYLRSDNMYGVTDNYPAERAFRIVSLRYAMGSNNYRRYMKTEMAKDVSQEAVVAVLENQARLPGVDISEEMVRRYEDSKYFAHILGYTGPVSEEELERFSEQGIQYDRNDVVGKAGIEQAMESALHGRNGGETFYVDSVGRVTEVIGTEEASTGSSIYLTIDADLQMAVYDLLEQKLAGILLANIVPGMDGGTDELSIPVQDVYYALIDNHVIDTGRLREDADGVEERNVYRILEREKEQYLLRMRSAAGESYGTLDENMQDSMDYILELLSEAGYYRRDEADRTTQEYREWQEGASSLEDFLLLGMREGWISMGMEGAISTYSSIEDNLNTMHVWIFSRLEEDAGLDELMYRILIGQGTITGEQISRILLEQGVTADGGTDYEDLGSGAVTAYSYIREKIRNLEITPAQLALNPCTASSVVTDPDTGQILACVTYPGYDNNRLANTVDGEYYDSLLNDASLPLYNNATQQRTAPGSTFKPITVAAGLTENMITPDTVIEDYGIFEEITPSPRCWIYSTGATHGTITVREAIRDSCNYFFYTIGHSLSLENAVYQENKGTETLRSYAQMFGLGENSGIEITESQPQIADSFPVVAAIGQSNHNYTTTQLARYTAVLANKGKLPELTLIDRIQEETVSGGTQKTDENSAQQVSSVNPAAWDAIGEGMRMMAESNSTLNELPVSTAGKTGTAQQNPDRPNHALFIGFAPYEQPEIAVATRIAYGYSSSNAVEVTADIFKYYFGIEDRDQLLSGQAEIPGDRGNRFAD